MITKIKTQSKHEIGLLLSIALFAILLVYNQDLFVNFELENIKAILLFLSISVALYFSISQYWTIYKNREEKKYKSKLEDRFQNLAKRRQEVYNSATANELKRDSKLGENSITLKELEKRQEDLEWLQKLEMAISDSISDFDFTLERLSAIMYLSPRQIRRRLKQLTGKKYSVYLREIRMKRALQLLENREVRLIKQVAYEIGMRDVKYFSQQFKAYFGKLPSAYL